MLPCCFALQVFWIADAPAAVDITIPPHRAIAVTVGGLVQAAGTVIFALGGHVVFPDLYVVFTRLFVDRRNHFSPDCCTLRGLTVYIICACYCVLAV